MKVFISWSGDLSQLTARALSAWLPKVAQHVKPWMSDQDIQSGARWNDQVAKALDETDFGLVCVTASNQHQPWLIFEAGALAKRLEVARVVPLCIDLAPAAVTGPLEAFQGRTFDQEGMRRLVRDIMRLREDPPPQTEVDEIFDALWGTLEAQINKAKERCPGPKESRRPVEDMLEEIVDRVRRLERKASVSEFTSLTAREMIKSAFRAYSSKSRGVENTDREDSENMDMTQILDAFYPRSDHDSPFKAD